MLTLRRGAERRVLVRKRFWHFQNHDTTVNFFFSWKCFISGWAWHTAGHTAWHTDGMSKVSFNYLHALWIYRSCLCILICIVKSCPHKFLVGLKNWSSWGPDTKIPKHPLGRIFLKSYLKSKKNTKGFPCKLNPYQVWREFSCNFFSRSDQFLMDFSFKFEGDFNFLVNFFLKGISLKKLKLISFFIARYLTVTLWGPVLTLRRGALRRVVV